MKKILSLFLLVFGVLACQTTPKNYTYAYDGKPTGLAQLIDIDGVYISRYGCDSTFFSIFRFYPDGKFQIATTSEVSKELTECFIEENKNKTCRYILDGLYIIKEDTIKTQAIWPVGNGCVIFRDYLIQPDKSIINISDYVEPDYSNLGYMKNYPSYFFNPCPEKLKFSSLK